MARIWKQFKLYLMGNFKLDYQRLGFNLARSYLLNREAILCVFSLCIL